MRPKFDGSGILTVTSDISVGAFPFRSSDAAACAKMSLVTSGMSPQATTTRPCLGARWSRAIFTACPVPSCSSCTTLSTPNCSISSRSSELITATISSMPAPRSAAMTYHSIGRPQISCSTFVRALFIRVPFPAASTTARITRPPRRAREAAPTLRARVCSAHRADPARFGGARAPCRDRAAPSNRRGGSTSHCR